MVFYLFKVVAKLFAPMFINYAVKKTQAHFREKFGDFAPYGQDDEERVGDVIIDKKPETKKSQGQKVGDYIDFEEID